jgi:predicted MFS family arabinose efflux permease
MALVIALRGNYRVGFAVLLISALLCLAAVAVTEWSYPKPQEFERTTGGEAKNLPPAYWLYLAGSALIGFGFVDFGLIAFHFQKSGTVPNNWIPIFYAAAMGAGAIGNLLLGLLYDKAEFWTLIGVFLISSFFTPLVFFGGSAMILVGMGLWGVNMGSQDTLLKPTIASLIAAGRRSTAFGIFDTGFGVAWLVGSIAFGLLYDKSLLLLVIISVVGQLASLPIFFLARNASRNRSS